MWSGRAKTRAGWDSRVRSKNFSKNDYQKSKGLRKWIDKLRENWKDIQVISVDIDDKAIYQIGENVNIRADIQLGHISPEEVLVEAYYGSIDDGEELQGGVPAALSYNADQVQGKDAGKTYRYGGTVKFKTSGQGGISIRVLPKNPELSNHFIPDLICWASRENKEENGNNGDI